MSHPSLDNLLKTQVTRKQFLGLLGIAFLSLFGLAGVKRLLSSRASTPTASTELEAGAVGSPAAIVSDTSASGSSAVKFKAATPPPSTKTLVGMFNGNPNEDPDNKFQTSFGAYPEISSSYYTGQAVNETYEKARLARGTTIFMDLDSKNTPGMIGEVANKSATGLAFINSFLQSAEKIATSSSNGAKVYVAFVHEWEVKRAQNVLTDTADSDIPTYAKAHSVFNQQAATLAPHCLPGYWTGGSPNNQTIMSQVMAAMTTPCKWVSYDPYVTTAASFQTFTQHNAAGAAYFKNDATYKLWGNPPIFITEFGCDTSHGDTNCATYMTDLRNAIRSLGVSGCIEFNRNKTDNNGAVVAYQIDTGSTPKTQAAFKASIQST